jgi:hypothetical protein
MEDMNLSPDVKPCQIHQTTHKRFISERLMAEECVDALQAALREAIAAGTSKAWPRVGARVLSSCGFRPEVFVLFSIAVLFSFATGGGPLQEGAGYSHVARCA